MRRKVQEYLAQYRFDRPDAADVLLRDEPEDEEEEDDRKEEDDDGDEDDGYSE